MKTRLYTCAPLETSRLRARCEARARSVFLCAVPLEISLFYGKDIHAWVDFWGYDVDHDWDWW
ncbi:MAG: hypothetical protein ACFNQG_07695, partial [Treponema socranskii subsp. buccale]